MMDDHDDLFDDGEDQHVGVDEAEDGFTSMLLDDGDDVFDGSLDDEVIGDDSQIGQTMPGAPGPVEPYLVQPMNRATMCCLRGPCIHWWSIVSRQPSDGERVRIRHNYQCTCSGDETPLNGANVYFCSRWWPAELNWVPRSLRGQLRPYVQRVYEVVLKHLGYDFAWRHFDDQVFLSEGKDMRGNSGPGGARRTHLYKDEER